MSVPERKVTVFEPVVEGRFTDSTALRLRLRFASSPLRDCLSNMIMVPLTASSVADCQHPISGGDELQIPAVG